MVERHSTRLDRVFRALASEPRREIMRRASSGPRSVSQLAEHFDMSLAAVSKHVQVLVQADLVSITQEGRVRWCRAKPDALNAAARSLDELRSFWNERLDGLDAFLSQPSPGGRRRS